MENMSLLSLENLKTKEGSNSSLPLVQEFWVQGATKKTEVPISFCHFSAARAIQIENKEKRLVKSDTYQNSGPEMLSQSPSTETFKTQKDTALTDLT